MRKRENATHKKKKIEQNISNRGHCKHKNLSMKILNGCAVVALQKILLLKGMIGWLVGWVLRSD